MLHRFSLFGLYIAPLYSQLVVTEVDTTDIAEFADLLAGPEVIITNVVIDCLEDELTPLPDYPSNGYGKFNCIDCNLGITSGILLTTGSILKHIVLTISMTQRTWIWF